ncbi:hypothetical protein L9F63_023504, partial [Diploptera punctata]
LTKSQAATYYLVEIIVHLIFRPICRPTVCQVEAGLSRNNCEHSMQIGDKTISYLH